MRDRHLIIANILIIIMVVLVSDEATVVSVNMFVRDFIEINDLKMVNI